MQVSMCSRRPYCTRLMKMTVSVQRMLLVRNMLVPTYKISTFERVKLTSVLPHTCTCKCLSTHTHTPADGSLLNSTLIPTPSPPVHVALSCDSITLSVCVQANGELKCYFYDTRGLSAKVAEILNVLYICSTDLYLDFYFREQIFLLSPLSLSAQLKVGATVLEAKLRPS